MKILVTGATGFVGRHLVPRLLERGHAVTAVARDAARARAFDWYDRVHFVACDIHDSIETPAERFGQPDAVAHLAWPGLPNYDGLFHIEHNLPADYRFLKSLLDAGIGHLLVAGTCLEYGIQNGPLAESGTTDPAVPYGLAKDTLRKLLQSIQRQRPFRLQWARLFYMHGAGQNPNSLLAQLDRAIEGGEKVFNMSTGDQLRDYLPVEVVAARLALLLEHPKWDGVINICSGKPISVRQLVEQHIASRGAEIRLNLGYYSRNDFEPIAFWGDSSSCLSTSGEKNAGTTD